MVSLFSDTMLRYVIALIMVQGAFQELKLYGSPSQAEVQCVNTFEIDQEEGDFEGSGRLATLPPFPPPPPGLDGYPLRLRGEKGDRGPRVDVYSASGEARAHKPGHSDGRGRLRFVLVEDLLPLPAPPRRRARTSSAVVI
ncbi:hypothetical protein EVAR_67027_1 [Eumeta japonica]|uniref:Uncharacterized protein n=1 Tax=Eumeta variegata TaxID=151549 RepID=A0A4C1ZW88_EUMVA|nr:hypothetical protein EVAR_67027_1 [Eumeta japonica]